VKNEKADLLDSLCDCTSLEAVFVVLKDRSENEETEPDLFLKHLTFDNALGESYREDGTPKIGPGPQVTPDVFM
jgi:hypothetical protein